MMSLRSTTGFTLVETLVAITIITLALVGPFYAVQFATTTSFAARDRLIATSLAQEGIEFAHGVRDSNYIYDAVSGGSRQWLAGFDGTPGGVTGYANCFSKSCMVDAYNRTISVCSSGTCTPLNLSSAGFYNQAAVSGSNAATRFTRSLRFTWVTANEVKVVSTVTWKTGQQTYTVNVTDTLANWL